MADQLVVDEAGDTGASDEGTILTTEIDLEFAPRPIDDVKVIPVGDELVLYDPADEILLALDRVGAIVWQCFDGEVTLGELADDIVAVLDAPAEQVQEDLLVLAKRLGIVGFLAGVTTPEARNEALGTLHVGEEVAPFVLPDMNGDDLDITQLRGHRVLLVNWSPTCGFCLRIAPELAELTPLLAEKDVELVLLSNGSPEENQEVFDAHGLHVRTFLEPNLYLDEDDEEDDGTSAVGDEAGHADHDHGDELQAAAEEEHVHQHGVDDDGFEDVYPDPFPAMGTPVAYLLDADGRVAVPLATGATEVPALARSLAGIEEVVEEQLPADAKYVNVAGNDTCGPGGGSGKSPRVWAATGAYQIGEYRVGVRVDSTRTDEILAQFLAATRLPDGTRAPDDYSVVLGDGGTTKRGLNLVLEGGSTVVRTRSPRRALMGLASYLSSHLPAEPSGPMLASCLTVIMDGEAVILPSDVNGWLDELQPRLARLGAAPIDRSFVAIDVQRREVIVDEPALPLDLSVLDDLPEPAPRRSERPMVEPGRYPLRRWLIWQSNEEPTLTRGQLVTQALSTCVVTTETLEPAITALDALREDGILFPFDFMTIDQLVKRFALAAAGQPHDEPAPVDEPQDEPATA